MINKWKVTLIITDEDDEDMLLDREAVEKDVQELLELESPFHLDSITVEKVEDKPSGS